MWQKHTILLPPPLLDIQHALKMYAVLDLSLLLLISLALKNTFGQFLWVSMKQLLTSFLKEKTYHIMFLWFKIYLILLLISFHLTKTNMFFVLVFFKLGHPGCRVRPPPYVRVCPHFCNPLPPSPLTSFVKGP